MKIAILVCLAALAAAEPEAEAWYGPYGYSNWGYNWMNGNNMMNNMYWGRPGYSQGYMQRNYMNGHEGHRYQSFHKREAEAEPQPKAEAEAEAKAEPKAEAQAEAKAEAKPYVYFGNYWPMNYNYNYMHMPMYSQYGGFYHKRSADADAWYGPYGYSNMGYNWNMYMNRPYYHHSAYRYHF